MLFINLVPVTTFAVQALRGETPHAGRAARGGRHACGALLASNVLARRAQPVRPASSSATVSSPVLTSAYDVDSGESPILSPCGSR